MIKTLAFISVLLVLMFALQPQFFMNLLGLKLDKTAVSTEKNGDIQTNNSTNQNENSILKNTNSNVAEFANKEAENGSKLLVSNPNDLSPAEGETQYANGYSKKDFGKAYQAPKDENPDAPKDKTEVEGVWKTLLKLTYNIKYDERIDDMAFIPIFTAEIKALEGKEIELKGYILPHDITKMDKSGKNQGNMFMFSAFPAQSCFFCGAAGPESVVEVNPKKPIPYSKNAVKIKGKLELNSSDFLRMTYLLKDARVAN
jgi:hypothetical protein